MKKNPTNPLLHLFFLLSLLSGERAWGQCWEVINPMPINISPTFTGISMLDSNTFFMSGRSTLAAAGNDTVGVILKSYDHGRTWHKKNGSLKFSTINQIYFPSSRIGYAAGYKKSLLKTYNGGESWEKLNFSGYQGIIFQDIHFLNDTVGMVVFGESGKALVKKTNDGGKTWKEVFSDDINFTFSAIHFIDEKTGWICGGRGEVFKTTDGGETWFKQVDFFFSQALNLFDIYFLDSLNGWASGYGYIIHSADGGQTWEYQWKPPRIPVEPGTTELQEIYFQDTLKGWVAGFLGTVLHTDDGGRHWRRVTSPIEARELDDVNWQDGILITPSGEVFIAGDGESILGYRKGGTLLYCKGTDHAPDCSQVRAYLAEGNTAVPIQPMVHWSKVTTECVDGYYIHVGTSPGAMDVQAYINPSPDTAYTFRYPLPYDTKLYISVVPYNCSAVAEPCHSFEFTTEPCPLIESTVDTIIKKGQTFLGELFARDTVLQRVYTSFLGCDSTVTYRLMVDVSSIVNIGFPSGGFMVFPNPATHQTQIKFWLRDKAGVSISIFDAGGQKIRELENRYFSEGNHSLNLALEGIQPGMYFLKIQTGKGLFVQKLVIAH